MGKPLELSFDSETQTLTANGVTYSAEMLDWLSAKANRGKTFRLIPDAEGRLNFEEVLHDDRFGLYTRTDVRGLA